MTETAALFIDCRCELGEGPLWHHLIDRLFFFDILNFTLFSADPDGRIVERFLFDEPVSAAAIIDADTLAVATASALLRLTLPTDERTIIMPLEADMPGNRSNDGRAHPAGGLWIGTMSRKGDAEPGLGALYQYRKGELTRLRDDVTIPNAICFSPSGNIAYFADTPTQKILKCAVDRKTGLPSGAWSLFADVAEHRGFPDGAVVDSQGFVWNARWGGGCVVRHAPDGTIDRIVEVPVSQVSCPVFGGPDLKTLFVTTAREHMTPKQLEAEPLSGSIFSIRVDVPGLPAPQLLV